MDHGRAGEPPPPARNLPEHYRWMGLSIVVALAALAIAATRAPDNLLLSLPFVLAWLAAPALVYWLSLVRPDRETSELTADDAAKLRSIARHTWRYFETFVTAEDNHLPPDNFQEDPRPTVAHRTSPTNIGLYLLSVVAARDFGWIGLLDKAERLEATLGTMNRMQRFRGHFYNWYDTTDLRPLDPEYVSSVDSGNLAGHLIVARQSLRGGDRRPAPRPGRLHGHRRLPRPDARSTLPPARDCPATASPARRSPARSTRSRPNLQSQPFGGADPVATLVRLDEQAAKNRRSGRTPSSRPRTSAAASEVAAWAAATRATIDSHLRDLALIPDAFAGARDKDERSFPLRVLRPRREPQRAVAAVAAAPSQELASGVAERCR